MTHRSDLRKVFAALLIAAVGVGLGVTATFAAGIFGESPRDPEVSQTEEAKPNVAPPKSSTEATRCMPPAKVKRGMYVLKGYCPRSEAVDVGKSERITIGMVHKSPCWNPPDFDGSYWRTHTHLPRQAMGALHGGITGKMTLVRKNVAIFRASAIRTRERLNQPFVRVPAEGGFFLRFHRVEGGIRSAGCS